MMSETVYYDNVEVKYKYQIVNEKSNFVMTGYYWGSKNINKNSRDGKTYEQLGDRLIQSCITNGCNYFIAIIDEFAKPGGYQIAINYKPKFLIHTMKIITPRSAINIDTDMVIAKYPSLFDIDADYFGFNWYAEPRTDIGIDRIECYAPNSLKTSGGIMGFGNTQQAKRFLQKWDSVTDSMPGKAEDVTISIPFAENNELTKLRCVWLPLNYFYIPFFYESEDTFIVPKHRQKFFPHLKFKGDKTVKEYEFGKIYKLTKSNVFIVHPEGLTSEEEAAMKGSSTNRVPYEYNVEVGKKLRCLTTFNKLINIPKLYCNNATQIKDYSQMNESIDSLDWKILQTDIPKISKKCEFKILEEHIVNEGSSIFVFVNSTLPTEAISGLNHIVCEYTGSTKPVKSFLISKIMKKYSMYDVIYIENCCGLGDRNALIKIQGEIYNSGADFGCINGNGEKYPCYKTRLIDGCYDPRSLNAMTSDILYFRNNKYGRNMLNLWNNSLKSGVDDHHSLSMAFNRYGCVVFMRNIWFGPGYFYPIKQKIFKIQPDIKIYFDSELQEKIPDIDLFDYFKQCGSKRAISYHDTHRATHFNPSKY